MSGSGFCERKDAVDYRFETSVGNEAHDAVQLRLRSHVGAEKRKLAAEEEAQIQLGIIAGSRAAGDESAAGSETGEAVIPRNNADVFENDVDAALVGDAANLVANFLRFVIDDMVGAEFFGFGELLVGAGGGNHMRAKEFGDLYGGCSNAAACAEDEHIFAGLKFGAGEQHVPSGLEDQRDGSGFFPLEIFGIGEAVDLGDTDQFSAAAVNHVTKVRGLSAAIVEACDTSRTFTTANQWREHYLLANAYCCDIRTNLLDFTRNVAAGDVRKRNRNVEQATAHPQVQMIERASSDAHNNVVSARPGLRRIGVFQDFRPAVLVKQDCIHAASALNSKGRTVTLRARSVYNAARIDTENSAP